MNVLCFDCESDTLTGQTFAVGAVLLSEAGDVLATHYGRLADDAPGHAPGDWVRENVLPALDRGKKYEVWCCKEMRPHGDVRLMGTFETAAAAKAFASGESRNGSSWGYAGKYQIKVTGVATREVTHDVWCYQHGGSAMPLGSARLYHRLPSESACRDAIARGAEANGWDRSWNATYSYRYTVHLRLSDYRTLCLEFYDWLQSHMKGADVVADYGHPVEGRFIADVLRLADERTPGDGFRGPYPLHEVATACRGLRLPDETQAAFVTRQGFAVPSLVEHDPVDDAHLSGLCWLAATR